MADINFTGPANHARGRNNWFVPRSARLWTSYSEGPRVVLDIHSSRIGDTPPIVLYLNRDDARTLAWAILAETRHG